MPTTANDTESLERLNKEIEALAENDLDGQIFLSSKQFDIQKSAVERDKNQIQALEEAFDRGDITAAQFKNTVKEITNLMIDSSIAARDYTNAINQINLDRANTNLESTMKVVELV